MSLLRFACFMHLVAFVTMSISSVSHASDMKYIMNFSILYFFSYDRSRSRIMRFIAFGFDWAILCFEMFGAGLRGLDDVYGEEVDALFFIFQGILGTIYFGVYFSLNGRTWYEQYARKVSMSNIGSYAVASYETEIGVSSSKLSKIMTPIPNCFRTIMRSLIGRSQITKGRRGIFAFAFWKIMVPFAGHKHICDETDIECTTKVT